MLTRYFIYIYKTIRKIALLVHKHKMNSIQLDFLISITFGVPKFQVLFIVITTFFFLSLFTYDINFNYGVKSVPQL